MSHSFRLLAVGLTVVLCLIEAPVSSFTLSRPTNFTHEDLDSEESINLEIKNDVRRPNGIELTKENVLVPTSEIYFKDLIFITTTQDLASDSSMDAKQNVELSIQNIEKIVNKTTIPMTNENTESNKDNIISNVPTQTEINQTPLWKKYTKINRKVENNEVIDGNQTEGMLTDETGVPRQDSKSGDIPSLNQIKNFLFPSSFFKSDIQNDTTNLGVIEQSLPNSPETTIESTTSKSGSATVESKRGGFLDFSLKSLFEDNSDKKDNSQENRTSKPKGRRLSWRFGSRYRGKEDSSGEKSKERTRYRFKNNKNQNPDNNNTKESKEEYSREVESREDSNKKSTKVIDKDNNNENNQNELEKKIKADDDTKQVSNSKEILTERKDYGKVEESKNEENSHKELITSIERTTTNIDIWKTRSGEEKHKHEKAQRQNMENNKKPDIKENKSTNSRESSRENYSKNKGRDNSDDYRSRARNDKDSKERNNEHRKDKNNHRNTKEFDSQNREDKQRYHNELKSDGLYSYLNNSEKLSNKKFKEGQLSQYTTITTTESNEKSETEYIENDNNPTTENVDIKSVKPENNNSEKQVTIEFIKQYLSTIDEEEENETLSPIIEETTTTKPIEVPYIEADKHSFNFKLNNIDSTTEPLDSYKPFNIPNLLISLPRPKNKGGALETRIPNKNSDTPQKQSSVFPFEDKLKHTVEKSTKLDNTEKQKYVTEIINTSDEPRYRSQNKDVKNTEAIVQKHEDDRREELLKEEIINNYEENVGRFKDESITTTQTTIPVKIYEINKKTGDEKLSVKPLSFLEKFKSTILYPVGANYKPLKKLEVQPPKQFVRDPDDNSWRNESLSSLGIVFKPKNSSKPFTQVLKNKTETEWNNLVERQNKNETPDLRERLEKITEIRKSKKKKIDAYGNILYNDYEESFSKEIKESESTTSTTKTTTALPFTPTSTAPTIIEPGMLNYSKINIKATIEKPKKVFNGAEYYDTSEEDNADYLTLAKIDLKKFTVPIKTDAYVTPPTWFVTNARHENINNNDRKPTLQYFPPLTTQKGMYRDFNTDFHQKMGAYTDTEPPTNVLPVSYSKPSTSVSNDMKEHMFTPNSRSYFDKTTTRLIEYEKPGYMTQPPILPDDKEGYTVVTDDGSYNRAADVIKHYRDFLNAVAKDHEEDINEGYSPNTKPPTQGVTVSETIDKFKPKPEMVEHYDYENDFRKDVLQRFVHNFNQNSERFKSDLPLLYNNSIIHGNPGEGRDVASSRAYLSRMLPRPAGDCDNNATVELSPAYELHYYVPEEEEKQQVDQKPATLPYQYRL